MESNFEPSRVPDDNVKQVSFTNATTTATNTQSGLQIRSHDPCSEHVTGCVPVSFSQSSRDYRQIDSLDGAVQPCNNKMSEFDARKLLKPLMQKVASESRMRQIPRCDSMSGASKRKHGGTGKLPTKGRVGNR